MLSRSINQYRTWTHCSRISLSPASSDVRSNCWRSGWLSMSMNIVGVPYRKLHLWGKHAWIPIPYKKHTQKPHKKAISEFNVFAADGAGLVFGCTSRPGWPAGWLGCWSRWTGRPAWSRVWPSTSLHAPSQSSGTAVPAGTAGPSAGQDTEGGLIWWGIH